MPSNRASVEREDLFFYCIISYPRDPSGQDELSGAPCLVVATFGTQFVSLLLLVLAFPVFPNDIIMLGVTS